MWPSMEATVKDSSRKTDRQRERALLDWAQGSQDNSRLNTQNDDKLSDFALKMRNEMQELTLWLEGDESLQEDPWKPTPTDATMSSSPTAMEFGDVTPRTSGEVVCGFDDDFTVFISAPVDPIEFSGRSTPEADPGDSMSSLALPHAGELYRSLGSMSDLGSDNDDDDDEGLPNEEEIFATSQRIFGESKVLQAPGMESRTSTVKLEDPEWDTLSGDGLYEMAPFDLTKVLGALQEMKAEIANMEDEGERRRAAAKVALGLVYGLEAE